MVHNMGERVHGTVEHIHNPVAHCAVPFTTWSMARFYMFNSPVNPVPIPVDCVQGSVAQVQWPGIIQSRA